MKNDIESIIDELLKKSEGISKKSNFKFKGKILSRDKNSIDFATENGILEIPIAEIEDIVQLSPNKTHNQGIVEIKIKSLTKTSFKYRVPLGRRPGGFGGFGGLNVFTVVDHVDTTTITYQNSPDATDDVNPVGTDDPDGPIIV